MEPIHQLRETIAARIPDAFLDVPRDEAGASGDAPAIAIWQDSEASILPPEDESGPGDYPPIFEFAAAGDVDAAPVLGPEQADELRRAVLVKGVDALGWYVSFHIRGPQWGVYLPMSGLVYFALEVLAPLKIDWRDRMRLAAHCIHQHELFHFSTDYMSALWEMSQRKPCWKPARALKNAEGYIEREEKLANGYMLRRIHAVPKELGVKGRADAVRKSMARQPAGYRDGVRVASTADFEREARLLGLDYFEQANGGPVERDLLGPLVPELLLTSRRLDWRRCPVHVVHDEKRWGLPDILASLLRCVSFVAEHPDFRRELARCDLNIRKKWEQAKRKLAIDVNLPGLDFKPWPRKGRLPEYSVRVGDNYRAHLLSDPNSGSWTALGIGSHKAMGHG